MANQPIGGILNPLAVGILGVGAFAAIIGCSQLAGSGVAETPAVFDETTTLDSAMAQASREGKYVFAVTTADWCGPCQAYKRGALTDARVEQWVDQNAVPVYINADADKRAVNTLGVKTLPTTTILRDGKIIAEHSGNQSADALLSMLNKAG